MIALLKILTGGTLIWLSTEVGKRSGPLAGLILSLPLTSMIALSWLWFETRNPEKVASMTIETFWFILPSLVLFLLLPILMRKGVIFPWAMALSVIATLLSYWLFFRIRSE
jgi:hypothetical protein